MNTLHSTTRRGHTIRVVWGPQRFYLSIGWKTLIAFFLVVFVPMLGLMQITGSTIRDGMESEALKSLAVSMRGSWSIYFERIDRLTNDFELSATEPGLAAAIQSRNEDALSTLLNRISTHLPYADVLLLVDRDRKVMARRSGPAGDRVYVNNLITRAVERGQAVTSSELLPRDLFLNEDPLRYGGLSQSILAQVSVVPIKDGDEVTGAFLGLILLNGNAWLSNSVHDNLSVDAAIFSSVVQESQVISTAYRVSNIWAEGVMAPAPLNAAIKRRESFSGHIRVNDIPSLVIAEPIMNHQKQPIGALALGVRDEHIELLIQRNKSNVYLFIAIGIGLSLIIAYLAYRDTVTPIRAMVEAMDAFANNQLGVRTEIRTKDEFEQLGDGFNRMAESVEEHQQRMEKFNTLSSLLISTLNPRQLLQKTLDKVVELTKGRVGVIYLHDKNSGTLQPFVTNGIDIKKLPALDIGEGLPGQAAEQKRLLRIDGVDSDTRIVINFGIVTAVPKEILAAPLVFKDELLGVMLLGSTQQLHEDELPAIEYMTNQIAIVLENALTHEKLELYSVTDALTGLYNRRYLSQRLDHEFSKAQRYGYDLSLMILDLDHFKNINDKFGHLAGDSVLISVARLLRNCFRETDLVGRYGGEEFFVILPHTNQEQAKYSAEKLRSQLAELAIDAIGGGVVTTSIGVASFPESGIHVLDELVRRADNALYAAKEQGRNCVVQAQAPSQSTELSSA